MRSPCASDESDGIADFIGSEPRLAANKTVNPARNRPDDFDPTRLRPAFRVNLTTCPKAT